MNTYTISLSSNSSNYIKYLSPIFLEDNTTLTILPTNLYSKIIPKYIKIDWGDGNSEIFDNQINIVDRNNIDLFSIGSIFNSQYSHEYYPSDSTLYYNLTAQVLLNYSDNTVTWFVIPLIVRTYDYFESIYDMELLGANILPEDNNPCEFYFKTEKNNTLIELRSN